MTDEIPRRWERWAARLARDVEHSMDSVRSSVFGRPAARQVVVYRGYGTRDEAVISGRVLANRPVPPATASDAWWRNLGNALRHLETDEVTGARVRITLGDSERHAVTDDEGYFRAWLRPARHEGTQRLWHDAHVEVIEPVRADAGRVAATGQLLIPRHDADFGVISDIDDTVIRTDATRLVAMLRSTLLHNARTRLPFPGVAQFYTGLHGGPGGVAGNPIFYVSSSPWNLYPVLADFLEHQSIPLGPLLLRDWGLSEHGVLPTRHGRHKLGAIRDIMQRYPALPFILVGDSGQEDPEIYRTIVHDFGARVLAVYIRNVTPGPERAAAVRRLAAEVAAAGSELLLSDDSLASARHARDRGWLPAASLDAVAAAVSSA